MILQTPKVVTFFPSKTDPFYRTWIIGGPFDGWSAHSLTKDDAQEIHKFACLMCLYLEV